MPLAPSELILNADQSIYHLHLKPQDLANTILTVGDPDRVSRVSLYFDSIEQRIQNREFNCHTGFYKEKRISVVSTGIGTDNIDIVLNELDALVNIDFKTQEILPKKTSLTLIRLGTSGAIQPHISPGSTLLSEKAIGFDGLLHFYKSAHVRDLEIEKALDSHLSTPPEQGKVYCVQADPFLLNHFSPLADYKGITATQSGFYGPQGRLLRLETADSSFLKKLQSFSHINQKITNLEMETSGIYGLSRLLGHKALSINAILANRATGSFSKNPEEVVDNLILMVLDRLALL